MENVKCPLCGGDIRETDKAYGCAEWQSGCKFTIWKNFYDKKITKTQAKDLIEKGRTKPIKGWVSRRTGKEFTAALALEHLEHGGVRVVFVFE